MSDRFVARRVSGHTLRADDGSDWALFVTHLQISDRCPTCREPGMFRYQRARVTYIHDEVISDKLVTYRGRFCSLKCFKEWHMPDGYAYEWWLR